MFNSNHKDSDRFVWRRAQSCLQFSSPYVTNEIENCDEKDYIELAAYTYDNSDIPYTQENQGRLLKIFNTKVKVETWYIYKLIITPTNTVYQLKSEDDILLEAITIDHRECGSSYYIGAMQSLYFGYVVTFLKYYYLIFNLFLVDNVLHHKQSQWLINHISGKNGLKMNRICFFINKVFKN
jgi:hypothetical protein